MPDLQHYVSAQLAAGYQMNDIRASLLASGWKETEVNAAIAAAQAHTLRTPGTRLVFGVPLALLVGVIIVLSPPLFSMFTFQPLLTLPGKDILTVILGAGTFVGGLLLWKGKIAGGVLVIVLALLFFILNGAAVLAALALIAGILGVKRK